MTQIAWRKIPVQIGSSHLLVRNTRSHVRSNRDRKGTAGQGTLANNQQSSPGSDLSEEVKGKEKGSRILGEEH